MKKLRNKKFALICAVVLTLMVSSGVTLAYFSDYEIALGEAKIKLAYQTEIHEDVSKTEKTITIKNTSDEETGGDVVVRVAIYGPDKMDVPACKGWTEKKADGYYYYKSILKPGEESSPITANIEDIPKTIDLSEMEIIVVHESAPVVYDSQGKVQKPDGWGFIPDITAPPVKY